MRTYVRMYLVVIAFALALLVIMGCKGKDEPEYYSHGTLQCGRCKRVIYDGQMAHYRGGFMWPVGEPKYHKTGQKDCVSELFGVKELYDAGHSIGYNDAVTWKPRQRFNDDFWHEEYIKGYNIGWELGVKDRRGE